jgi:aldose sugar dehydrogenase
MYRKTKTRNGKWKPRGRYYSYHGLFLLALFCAGLFLLHDQAYAQSQYEVLIEDLDTPWSIDFLPEDKMIYTERVGTISMYDGKVHEVGTIDVRDYKESGLLGLAVSPHFVDDRQIYVYYTHGDKEQGYNRVSRFDLDENYKLGKETILLDNIPSAEFHDGGRIRFGPDSLLYVTTGDATKPSSAQDISSLAGKILRMDKDGNIPADNPFNSYVYTYGHRNPQGLAWNGDTMYAVEHGPERHDEVNIIRSGADYGWPKACEEQDEGTKKPLVCYTDITVAPADVAYFDGSLYVTGLRGEGLWRIDAATPSTGEVILEDLGRLRALALHDGALYVSTSNKDGRGDPGDGDDKIIRVDI